MSVSQQGESTAGRPPSGGALVLHALSDRTLIRDCLREHVKCECHWYSPELDSWLPVRGTSIQ